MYQLNIYFESPLSDGKLRPLEQRRENAKSNYHSLLDRCKSLVASLYPARRSPNNKLNKPKDWSIDSDLKGLTEVFRYPTILYLSAAT